jgi:hypothetical protein
LVSARPPTIQRMPRAEEKKFISKKDSDDSKSGKLMAE